MAKVVRKVETKGGHKRRVGSRFGFLRKKLFWIITASVAVVATAGIILGVVLYNYFNKSTEVYVDDYFADVYTSKDGDEVTFTKATHAQVKLHTYQDSQIVIEHVFVFATDLSTFYPFTLMDDTDDDGDYDDDIKNETHEAIFKALIELQDVINDYNKTADDSNKAALYIVDTGNSAENKTGNGHDKNFANNNSTIYSDSDFVNLGDSEEDEDEDISGPLFSYHDASEGLTLAFSGYKGEDFIEYDKDNSSKPGLSLYGVNSYSNLLTPISNSAKYIKLGFVDETEDVVDDTTVFEFGNNSDYKDVNISYGDSVYKDNGLTVTALTSGAAFEATDNGHSCTNGIEVRFTVVRGAKVIIETANGNYKYDAVKKNQNGSASLNLSFNVKTEIVINFTGEDTLKSITVTYA